MFDAEFERFKTDIDLRTFAAGQGYRLDLKQSSRNSSVMRHANGDKIIICLKPDGHYTYWSPRDEKDNGTIIDFMKNRHKGLTLRGIREELRSWTVTAVSVPPLPELSVTIRDRQAVQDRFGAMRVAHHHPYLEQERCIPSQTLRCWRFDGTVKIDRHSNAVFPHYDRDGVCGYELRNRDFKGFASGGTKGLWLSKTIALDKRLVVSESAIDAISHAVLHPDGRTRYASIGGKPSPAQVRLLKVEIKRMPVVSEIVAAMDNDDAGRQLVAVVSKAFDEVRRAKQVFREHLPAGVKDWNEVLQARRRPLPVSSNHLGIRPV
jgi:hypothetical protein